MKRILGLSTLIAFILIAGACGSDAPEAGLTDPDPTTTTVEANIEENECGQYVGVWVATELRGSEEDEGGIYQSTLTLTEGSESFYFYSDLIEVFEEWTCSESEIVLSNPKRDETITFTIVDAETLQLGEEVLKRDE